MFSILARAISRQRSGEPPGHTDHPSLSIVRQCRLASISRSSYYHGREARREIGEWVELYNHRRPHAAHGGETPVRVYRDGLSASGPGFRPALQPTAKVA